MPAAPAPVSEVRARVMAGMISAVEAKGYANTTVADIARAARISRRTLYEHFEDKEACFLAAYSMMADEVIGAVAQAARTQPSGVERLDAASAAYLDVLAAQPEVSRSFLTEINAVGHVGVALRCAVNQRFASMMTELVTETVSETGSTLPDGRVVRPFDEQLAIALVGAINELVLQALVDGPAGDVPARLARLRTPVAELAHRMLIFDAPSSDATSI